VSETTLAEVSKAAKLRVAELAKRAQRASKTPSKSSAIVETTTIETTAVSRLPYQPEQIGAGAFGLPSVLCRAAVFTARGNSKGPRPMVRNELVGVVGPFEVRYRGEAQGQDDLDVLGVLFALWVENGRSRFVVSRHALLKQLGRTTGGQDHKQLLNSIHRLRSGSVDVLHAERGVGQVDGFLSKWGYTTPDERGQQLLEIEVNEAWCTVFGIAHWSRIDRQQRFALGRNGTAKALMAFYASGVAPFVHRYETLAKLCGLDTTHIRKVRQTIRAAHKALVDVGFLASYEAGVDNVTVVRATYTDSQARFLAKRSKPRKPRE